MSALVGAARTGLGALLDALVDAVIVLDDGARVCFANRPALALLGYRAEELVGAEVETLLPERTRRGGEIGRRVRAQATGEATGPGPPLELRARHRHGHDFPVEVRMATAHTDGAGLVVVTLREVGDRGPDEALERLAAVVRSSSDAIITTDLSGVITSWNRGARRMYGYSEREAIGQSVSMLMDEERRPELATILARVKQGRHVHGLETVRTGKDGRELTVSLSVAPLRDERGTVIGASTVARDITIRTRAEERVRALLESAPDAVVVVGEQGRMVLVNRQTEELFGYERQQMLHQSVEMLFPERMRGEDDRVGYVASPETRQTGAALELSGRRADGTEFPIEITFSPLETDEGVLVYAAIRDITERKLIEEELRRSNHDLEQFAYVASHDLSEPLRVIAGFVDLLARRYRGALDEEADRFIEFTISGVERMQALIDDLLAYSRAGRIHVQRREVETQAVVREVLWTLTPQLRARNVQVEVGELPRVWAQQTMLRQIFQNLIANAVKFCDASEARIRIGARRLAESWCFEIEDNGPGIEPRHAERVFEMFQRLHGRDTPGSGIGLAIVKRLTERHGGRVWVSTAGPRGSIFSFTIPDRPRGA